MPKVLFGVRLPNSGPLANEKNIVDTAKKAEELGFHSVWVHDHILWSVKEHQTHLSAGAVDALKHTQEPNFFESITTLTYIAGRFQRINLGIAVIVLPLRNPIVLAKQLANLDVLSHGRISVGVAPGAPNITIPEFEAVGVSYHERGKITDEYILAMKSIWRQRNASFSGRYVNFSNIQMFPKPSDNLKILIGGGERGISERALRRVIECGDGWIPAYLTPEEIAEGIFRIKDGLSKSGRNSNTVMVVHEMFTALAQESNELGWVGPTLNRNFGNIQEAQRRSLVGSPTEIIKKLEAYEGAGVNITELKFMYPDMDSFFRMLELFSKQVMSCFS